MKRPYSKPPTTHSQQVALLQSRGMEIPDVAEAEFYLQHLNYYRLVAYWLPFEASHASHQFRAGTSFRDVLNLYTFDRELRLLVMDAIERVEISVRSQWAYQMGHRHGPHSPLDPNLALDAIHWRKNLDDLTLELNRSDEVFIQHMTDTYSEPIPPTWAACEVMSLGLLSRWYRNLDPMPTRRTIADVYDLDERVLQSWLHHLSLVRNFCAHHARLWNREFAITPNRPRSRPATLPTEFMTSSRKLYNTLLILLHFMDTISPRHHWRRRLKNLISEHSIPVAAMGFPVDWLGRAIWQEARS